MLLAALMAFAHFIAFFAMAAALVLQLVLIQETMTEAVGKRIQRADRALVMSAVLLLVIGFLRVFYFEKGSEYYFANIFFLIKLGLFIIAAAISIYASRQFARWNGQLLQDNSIQLPQADYLRLKKIIHWELILIGGMMFCASMMAKGFGV